MPRKPHIDGWFRRLADDRLEIFFKVAHVTGQPERKIRASGPVAEMNELADWFEEKTGMRVNATWRNVARRPIPGQLSLTLGELAMDELSSSATLPDDG